MSLFFGTDGLRGKLNDDLSWKMAFKCGNALGSVFPNSKVLIGKDTRKSGSFLSLAFATGAMGAGMSVVDVGVCPTAGIAYLTNKLGFDFGVVISASHNPAEYNGIKIVDKFGKKLDSKKESELEREFLKEKIVPFKNIGVLKFKPELVKLYKSFLMEQFDCSLKGKTIIIDCSNGAASKIAPRVFKKSGATVIALSCKPNGLNINKNCGSQHIQNLQKNVVSHCADMGFAFDGDSDRLIAVDENGNVVDGDQLMYMLACFYQEQNKLLPPVVVGTSLTNKGVEKALNKKGISLIRTDVGDKHISESLSQNNLLIGGEQSGHIFVKDKLMTGDGILNAILVACVCVKKQQTLSSFFDFALHKQCNINIPVKNKMKIISSEKIMLCKETEEKRLANSGRILVRASGTEPCVRVMVETETEQKAKEIAERIASVVNELNTEF